MTRPGEFALIEDLFAPLATAPGAFGLRDDAAVVAVRSGWDLVATTDTIVAGVDFLAGDSADGVARKALRVNLSDLAAKGAEPSSYLLTLQLPDAIGHDYLRAFARALADDQRRYGIGLLGGDISATPGPLSVAITAFGHVPAGRMVLRSGARPGDGVFVTGTIGDSGGGLALLRDPAASVPDAVRQRLIARYRVPEPRVEFAEALRDATAAIDVSDGLLADLEHVAETSGVRIALEAARIPRSPELIALWGSGEDAVVRAATAGDDYEIAFTAGSPLGDGHLAVTRIGRVEPGRGVVLLGADGREIAVARKGFRHF